MAKTKETNESANFAGAQGASIEFRDKRFKARTIVVGKKTVQVVKGRVGASDADIIAFLDASPDFERV
jgi:hypothetical protein